MRADCSGSNASAWSDPVTAITMDDNTTITAFSVTFPLNKQIGAAQIMSDTIKVTLRYGTSVASVRTAFTTANSASVVKVGGVTQVSGSSGTALMRK